MKFRNVPLHPPPLPPAQRQITARLKRCAWGDVTRRNKETGPLTKKRRHRDLHPRNFSTVTHRTLNLHLPHGSSCPAPALSLAPSRTYSPFDCGFHVSQKDAVAVMTAPQTCIASRLLRSTYPSKAAFKPTKPKTNARWRDGAAVLACVGKHPRYVRSTNNSMSVPLQRLTRQRKNHVNIAPPILPNQAEICSTTEAGSRRKTATIPPTFRFALLRSSSPRKRGNPEPSMGTRTGCLTSLHTRTAIEDPLQQYPALRERNPLVHF